MTMTPSTGSANTYSSAALTLRGRTYRVPINRTSRARGRELLLKKAKRSIKHLLRPTPINTVLTQYAMFLARSLTEWSAHTSSAFFFEVIGVILRTRKIPTSS